MAVGGEVSRGLGGEEVVERGGLAGALHGCQELGRFLVRRSVFWPAAAARGRRALLVRLAQELEDQITDHEPLVGSFVGDEPVSSQLESGAPEM